MSVAPAWFGLQLAFAERAAALGGLPFERALLECTNLYRRLGLGRARDPDQPTWRAFVAGLRATGDGDRAVWVAGRCDPSDGPPAGPRVGCFEYEPDAETGTIRLHLVNLDRSGAGPLSRARRPVRLRELRALFGEIARAQPEARTVRGVSWLHGVEAYRRLYPPEYAASAAMLPTERVLTSMPLWGQFLDHRGRVKPDLAAAFLARLDATEAADDLATCFPHPVYAVGCSIAHFYRFYGVEPPALTGAGT